jgi:O-antigen ligase
VPWTDRSPSSSLALFALVTLAVLAPWPFGAVQPWAVRSVTAVGLLTAAIALGMGAVRGDVGRTVVPVWPLLGFTALGLAQVVPLPATLHALLAPGSDVVWHPADAAAAAVLGSGPFPISLDPDSTVRSVALVAGLALLAWLAAPAIARPRLAVLTASAVSAVGFTLSVYAIFARSRFGALLYGRFAVPTPTPFGPFVSKNHFAGYVVMAALLAAGLAVGLAAGARTRDPDWTASPRAGGVVLAMVAALAMALAALASLSRGGAIALGAGAVSLLALRVLQSRARRALLPALALAAVLGLVLVALVPPATHARMRDLGGASFRLGTWRDGLRLARSSPGVGIGLGAFHDAYPRFKQGYGLIRVEHAENDYVETLAESGVLGLGLALVGGALLLSRAARAGSSATSSDARVLQGIGAGAIAGLIALAVHSAVDFNLRIPSNAALAAVLVAVAAGAAGVRPRPLARARAAALALIVAGLLAAVAFLPTARWEAAQSEIRQAENATTHDSQALRLGRADVALGRLLRARPAHAESWLLLAAIRSAEGDETTAAALARHAVSLDPERPALREAAARLEGVARP